jgi:beta-glucosidase
MWGTGASSTQCEGAAPASDWFDWERAGRAPLSGDGNGFATRYAEDFATYAALGLTHHRLSIEWARIEPEPGRRDPAAVEHYRNVLVAARDAGVAPWVCLFHFTSPRWFTDAGGFVVEANRTGPWARHVDFVAETYGDLVHGWKPTNEPNIYPYIAYQSGSFPPGATEGVPLAMEAIQLATFEAAARLRQTGAPVATVFSLATYQAQDALPATEAMVDRLYANNWDSGLGLFRDGVLRVRDRDPVERPDLAGVFDLIGFSYYAALGVRDGRLAVHPEGAPVSPLGYGIWADGLAHVLDRLHAEVPGTPLLIAEYGIGTPDDTERAAYIERGLEIAADALARGIDVRGFFHWTGVDNYEWLHGYDVEFGLISRDRVVRPSAEVLRAAAAA